MTPPDFGSELSSVCGSRSGSGSGEERMSFDLVDGLVVLMSDIFEDIFIRNPVRIYAPVVGMIASVVLKFRFSSVVANTRMWETMLS